MFLAPTPAKVLAGRALLTRKPDQVASAQCALHPAWSCPPALGLTAMGSPGPAECPVLPTGGHGPLRRCLCRHCLPPLPPHLTVCSQTRAEGVSFFCKCPGAGIHNSRDRGGLRWRLGMLVWASGSLLLAQTLALAYNVRTLEGGQACQGEVLIPCLQCKTFREHPQRN